jgi:hypothetical protein
MKPIIIKNSIWLHILLIIACLAFVAAGILIIKLMPGKQLVGWLAIIFFGGGALLPLWLIADRRPRLIIDEKGIYDRTLHIDKIPWNEIEGAYKKSVGNQDFICLKLRDSQKYLPNLSGFLKEQLEKNLELGFQPINLNLTGIHGKTDQILELILKKSATSNPTSPSDVI